MPTRSLRLLALALVLGLPCVRPVEIRAVPQDHQVRGYLGTLTGAKISRSDDGHIVLTTEVGGDIRGLLTLTLTGGGTSGAATGSWALMAQYVQDLTADGSVALAPVPHVETEDHTQHREYIKFMRDGSLQGTVSAATLQFDADGRPCGLAGAELNVTSGSIKYAGAKGTGSILLTAGPDGSPITTYSFTF